MACEVEVNGAPALDSLEPTEEIEISSLKQSLKKNLQHDVSTNGVDGINGNSSNAGVENGHNDEINFELEVEPDTPRKRKYKQKQARGKQPKQGKKERKQRVSQRFVKSAEEEEEQESELSWDDSETQRKEEDDNSIIDVGEDSAVVVEYEAQTEDEEVNVESLELKQEPSTLSLLRDRMRFSISPRKSQEPSTSNTSATFERDPLLTSLKSITGRRALHGNLKDNEEAHCSLKRKAESDNETAPESKYFARSFSEHSPGWRFFASPFNRFWSPKKAADNSIPVPTPLRKLHEDVDDSLNAPESLIETMEISIDETKKDEMCDEKQLPVTTETDTQSQGKSRFNCNIM